MYNMNNFWSWAYDSRCYEQLRPVDDMNDSRLSTQGFKYYEQIKAMVDIKNFGSWAQGFGCYE